MTENATMSDGQTDTREFEVFFDGDCPLCMREIEFLSRRDKRGRVLFTDIAEAGFDASAYGLRQEDFMAEIRGRLASGTMVTGVEVFRQLYTAAGFGWAVWFTRRAGVSWLLDRAYSWFAKNRLRLTGRCDDGACELPDRHTEEAA